MRSCHESVERHILSEPDAFRDVRHDVALLAPRCFRRYLCREGVIQQRDSEEHAAKEFTILKIRLS